jgi:hypothetical protein
VQIILYVLPLSFVYLVTQNSVALSEVRYPVSNDVEDRAYTVNVIVFRVIEPYFIYRVPSSLFHTTKRAY